MEEAPDLIQGHGGSSARAQSPGSSLSSQVENDAVVIMHGPPEIQLFDTFSLTVTDMRLV
jgi:hypothetical protein